MLKARLLRICGTKPGSYGWTVRSPALGSTAEVPMRDELRDTQIRQFKCASPDAD
jgi:hypothetical protein